MRTQVFLRPFSALVLVSILASAVVSPPPISAQDSPGRQSIVHEVKKASERLEMTVNTSRILTLQQKILQAQVNNPEILELSPLSPNEIQVAAKSAGVTQVNLWSEDKRLYTIDVIVYGDAQELAMLLRAQFPNASLKVIPVGTGVMISGFVDQPEHARLIKQIAEQYYPEVIDNVTVSGVQQVLLHLRVMEVSRTKLRTLGFDFAKITGSNLVKSSVSGLLTGGLAAAVTASGDQTFSFGVVDGGSSFFGVLEAMRQDNLMKILAEPTLVTVSGRPAYFAVGGEFPILVPQSLGTVSIEFKKFGTQIDFVPIVLGNGRVRLEVRPRVSEIDNTRSVTIGANTVPGLRVRETDTGVEMQAGQTLAIAGLVQSRVEAENRGLPWISEVPYLGAAFRKVEQRRNEIELLILVTPELVEPMDAHEVPWCGPGLRTTSPSDWELFMAGHLEVPNCCPSWDGRGAVPYGPGGGPSPTLAPREGLILEEDERILTPHANGAGLRPGRPLSTTVTTNPIRMTRPSNPVNVIRPSSTGRRAASLAPLPPGVQRRAPAVVPRAGSPVNPTSPPNRYRPSRPHVPKAAPPSGKQESEPGFIGPIGYDVVD